MHCSTGLLLGARPLDNRKPSGDFYPVFRRLATFSLYLEKVTHSGFRKKLLLMDLKSFKNAIWQRLYFLLELDFLKRKSGFFPLAYFLESLALDQLIEYFAVWQSWKNFGRGKTCAEKSWLKSAQLHFYHD